MKKTEKCSALSPADSERLSDLILQHRNVIYKILVSFLHPEFDYLIEDCESEVMLCAVEHASELLSHPRPTGWFVVTTKNIARNACRKEIARTKNNVPAQDFELKTEDDPLENVLYQEWKENGVAEQLLSRLTPREREVYDLEFVEGKSAKDIAEQLQISVSTVRNIRKNIMDKIKRDVREHNFETL